jgi:hypothetical protein
MNSGNREGTGGIFSEKRGAQKNNIIEKMKNFIGAKVKGSSKVGRRENLKNKEVEVRG